MDKIRISAVKYANTYPFIYGLKKCGFEKSAILQTDHPADCAEKLISGKVDVGLIPVAVLPLLNEYYIIGDYCIGADGKVRTVMLLSNNPMDKTDTIYLDYRSRSSVNLVKVLAAFKWKKEFRWVNTSEGFDFANVSGNEAVVLIGDQCFEYENRFKVTLDLAEEWKQYTGLPFVFACWTANRKLDPGFIDDFNKALNMGVCNIPAVVEMFRNSGAIKGETLRKYLTENIDFVLDARKRKAIDLFLSMLKQL